MTKVVLVIPVYNEAHILSDSIRKLHAYMRAEIPYDWNVVIANNASTDNTLQVAQGLASQFKHVTARDIAFKGRGNALKSVWSTVDADVYAYCDADLSTDITYTKELFEHVLSGCDIVTGSRYQKSSQTYRSLKRLVLSKGYLALLRIFFGTKIQDFQCGFKAVNKKVIQEILPSVKDREWFFDTEMLLLAHRAGYTIKEIPVRWQESDTSTVNLARTSIDYLRQLCTMKFRR